MRTSSNGIAVLHYFEKCRLTAYPDPGSKDGTPWTIGWGHTGPEVHEGLVWTQQQADDALVKDLEESEAVVMRFVRVPLTQGQFDALVLFVFNCGRVAFARSTLLREVNAGDLDGAKGEFMRWAKNDGKVMLGLRRRRTAEVCLFNGFTGYAAIVTAKGVV